MIAPLIKAATHLDRTPLRYLYGSGSATGGGQITLRVQLTSAAPTGGVNIVLMNRFPDTIELPDMINVAAVETERTFKVSTSAVTDDTKVRIAAAVEGATGG